MCQIGVLCNIIVRKHTEGMADITEHEVIRENVMSKIVQELCEFIGKNQ